MAFRLNSCLNLENVCPHGVKAPQQPHHMLYNTIDFNLYRGGAREMERERKSICLYTVCIVYSVCYAPTANVKATASCLLHRMCQLYFGHPIERKPIIQAPILFA